MSFGPVRLYHATNIAGQVFRDRVSHDAAIANGWVDSPSKVGKKKEGEEEAPLKPWQKAVAARKAKYEKAKKGSDIVVPSLEV